MQNPDLAYSPHRNYTQEIMKTGLPFFLVPRLIYVKNLISPPPLSFQHLLEVNSLKHLTRLTLQDRITKSLLHLHKKKKPPSISAQFQVISYFTFNKDLSVLFSLALKGQNDLQDTWMRYDSHVIKTMLVILLFRNKPISVSTTCFYIFCQHYCL